MRKSHVVAVGCGLVFMFAVNMLAGEPATSPGNNKGENGVSFQALVSSSSQNGKLTRVHVGNLDDSMKTGYEVVLDAKGTELAKSRGAVQVKGKVITQGGKTMLLVEEFSKVEPPNKKPALKNKLPHSSNQ